MSRRKEEHRTKGKKNHGGQQPHAAAHQQPSPETSRPRFEIVLKCDVAGSLEAVEAAILDAVPPQVEVVILQRGVGAINQSDVFMAETGSRLVIGFDVDVDPMAEACLKRADVEIRLYRTIYRLAEDVGALALSLIPRPPAPEEIILGRARVIALFKSCRKGIIIGCEVEEGVLETGKSFRVITAMGPAYTGRIESIHIEKDAVKQAGKGQQAGIQIKNFNRVHVGDLVESFATTRSRRDRPWSPTGTVIVG